MEPVRFDALARALAMPASRRRFIRGVGVALLGYLLPIRSRVVARSSNQLSCGGSVRWEDGHASCPSGCLPCWDKCVDPRTDEDNCGGCGITCAAGRTCKDGICGANPPASTGTCRASTLRIWLNAFVPGVAPNYVRSGRILNGRPVSVYPAPLPSSNDGGDLWLLTDRPSSNPEKTPSDLSFTPDPNAPAQAHAEIEIRLEDLTILNQPSASLGSVVQVDSGEEGVRTRVCARPIREAVGFSDHLPGKWFRDRQKSQPNVLDLELKAAWSLGKVDENASTPDVDTECALNAGVAELPTIQIKGTVRITRDDANRNVLFQLFDLETKAAGLQMSPFPAFEMYAALDDGHLTQIFAHPTAIWSDNLGDNLVSSGLSNTVSLPCGCGDCFAGFTCGQTSCDSVPGYYVLSSAETLDPTTIPDDVSIDADVIVQVNHLPGSEVGSRRIYQSKKGAGQLRIAPIGFSAASGEELVVTAVGIHDDPPVTSPLFLHRISNLYGAVTSTQLEWKTPQDRNGRGPSFEVRFVFPDDSPGPLRGICCISGNKQVCTDHMVDPLNCGGCLHLCAPTQICLDGECACPFPRLFDGSRCIDGLVDDNACGTRLPLADCTLDGRICVDGTCVVPCGPGEIHCGPGVGCVDTRTNASHCNGCGNTCPSGQICDAGVCRCPDPGTTFCDGAGCVDTTSNPSHCSGCGIGCPPGEICVNSACQCSEPGKTFCESVGCVDTSSDHENCSGCGIPCASDQVCVDSTCRCSDPGMTFCEGVCVDLQSHPGHCGFCGNTCSACCVSGTCDPPGWRLCPSGCVDTLNDQNNCNGCDEFCPVPCLGGICDTGTGTGTGNECGPNGECPGCMVCTAGVCMEATCPPE
jgi:hypothetical protein